MRMESWEGIRKRRHALRWMGMPPVLLEAPPCLRLDQPFAARSDPEESMYQKADNEADRDGDDAADQYAVRFAVALSFESMAETTA